MSRRGETEDVCSIHHDTHAFRLLWTARNLPGYIAGYKVSSGRWRHQFTWCSNLGDRPGKRSATAEKCHSSIDLSLILPIEPDELHNEEYQAQRRHHHPSHWLWHGYVRVPTVQPGPLPPTVDLALINRNRAVPARMRRHGPLCSRAWLHVPRHGADVW